ncbi:MAG: hypothetical protein AB7G17_00820 [Phycisphaerales bacterium]
MPLRERRLELRDLSTEFGELFGDLSVVNELAHRVRRMSGASLGRMARVRCCVNAGWDLLRSGRCGGEEQSADGQNGQG